MLVFISIQLLEVLGIFIDFKQNWIKDFPMNTVYISLFNPFLFVCVPIAAINSYLLRFDLKKTIFKTGLLASQLILFALVVINKHFCSDNLCVKYHTSNNQNSDLGILFLFCIILLSAYISSDNPIQKILNKL